MGREGRRNVCVGIAYTIEDERLVVLVVKLGHPRDIYRKNE